MSLRVNAAVRNAFWLASRCYGLPITRIVELAPYLFVCAAEASLACRRARVAEIEASLDQTEALGDALPHLRGAIGPASQVREVLSAEKASIARREVLAADVPDGRSAREEAEAANSAGRPSYGFPEENPFVRYRKEVGPADTRVAAIDWLDSRSVVSTVCYADAVAFAGGDEEIADHIVAGFVALHEMPRALSSGEASAERMGWLRENSPSGDVSDEELARCYRYGDDEEQGP